MKLILSFLAVCFFASTSMANCPVDSSDAVKIIEAIESTDICFGAAQIAKNCAWGSSVDVGIAGAAQKVCDTARPNLDPMAQAAYEGLVAQCAKKYANESGTMYRSAAAFCALEVAETFVSVFAPIGY